jgi:diguanylate cyclase (GGDEF)-like protein
MVRIDIMPKSMQTILSLSLPALLLILAYLCLLNIAGLPALIINLLPLLPYLLLLVAGCLAYHFNQSILFYLALAFIAIQLITDGYLFQQHSFDSAQMGLIYSLIAILVPLNLLVYSFLQERGILSLWGFLKLFFIILQFLGAAWIVSSGQTGILSLIYAQILPWYFPLPQGMAQLSLLVFGLVITAFLIKLWFNNAFFTTTAIGVLLSLGLSFYFQEWPLAAPIFMSSVGLLMIICILQNTHSMAYLDELTEIPGRRALREEMMKLSGAYTVAMVDIDHFKKFNDTYGHDVGDDVLRMVASKLKRVTGGGKAFRYGGEEFVIIFARKKLADVLPHLEKLRETIAHSEFVIRGKDRPKNKPAKPKSTQPVKKISVTVSIGAAEKNRPLEKAEEVLKEADKALYRAKKKGRNCVCK